MQILQSGTIQSLNQRGSNTLIILSQNIVLKKGNLHQYVPVVMPTDIAPDKTGLNLLFNCRLEAMLVADKWSSCIGASINYLLTQGVLTKETVGELTINPDSVIPEYLLGKSVTAYGFGIFKNFITPLLMLEHVVSDDISEHVYSNDSPS